MDANVIAYFVITGDRSAEAEAVYRKVPIWIAPRFWRTELLNVLSTYVRKGDFDVDAAVARMDKAMTIVSLDVQMEGPPIQVLELSRASKCSGYDCEYVALAINTSLPLVTADKKVLAAFPAIAKSMDDFVRV